MKPTLWRFQFSVTTSFIIEVGEGYFRFYKNKAPVLLSGVPYGLGNDFLEAELPEIQYKQVNDVVFIAHPNHPPSKLSRLADNSWVWERIIFVEPPTLDENISNTNIAVSAVAGNDVDLVASDDIFRSGHVGSYWRIGHLRESAYIERFINGSVTSTDLRIFGDYEIHTYGVWYGEIQLQRIGLDWATSGADYEVVRKWTSRGDRNIDATGTADTDALYRIVFSAYSTGTDGRCVLEAVNAIVYGIVKITAVTDGQNAVGNVTKILESTAATTRWQEAAFSVDRGFPRTVEIHEERLLWGGTAHQPATIYGSVINDYENHVKGTEDDAALVFTLAGKELNALQWLVSQTDLLAGTTGGEWRITSRSSEKALTPATINAKQQSSYGSEYIQAHIVDGAILYVQRKGRKIRELVYSYDVERFVSADLTLLAEHVTLGGLVQIAHQPEPIPILWCCTGLGKLIGLTYARDQQVIGWHRHPIDGFVCSVQTLYGQDDADDEVWLVVRRTVDGEDRYYVELMDPVQWTEKEDAYFVDCGITYDGAPATEITGLDHLEGRTVDALADGAVIEDLVVTGGAVTLPAAASKVHVGLRFESKLTPMRLDSDQQIGVFAGKIRRISELVLRVRNALGIRYSNEGKTYDAALAKLQDAAATPLQTKDHKVIQYGALTYDSQVTIRQSKPLPFTLQAIISKYEETGK